MELIKVIILGIIISFVAVLLKQVKPEYSIICVVVGSVILLGYIFSSLTGVFDFFLNVVNKTGINENLFYVILKIIGVGYLIEFSAGICIDSGNTSIADKVTLAGKIIILLIGFPVITNLFNMILEII